MKRCICAANVENFSLYVLGQRQAKSLVTDRQEAGQLVTDT